MRHQLPRRQVAARHRRQPHVGPTKHTTANFWGIAQVRNSAPTHNSITRELLSLLPPLERINMSCAVSDERDCSSNPILRRLGVHSDASGHFTGGRCRKGELTSGNAIPRVRSNFPDRLQAIPRSSKPAQARCLGRMTTRGQRERLAGETTEVCFCNGISPFNLGHLYTSHTSMSN